MGGLAVDLNESLFDGGAIDVPSRLLNERQWPSLLRLYAEAGVETCVVDPAQTYASEEEDVSVYLRVNPASLFLTDLTQLWTRGATRLFSELNRLRKSAEMDLQTGIENSLTFGEYLLKGGYASILRYGFLYPLLSSTVCTCSFQALDRYPAKLVLGILDDLNQSGYRQPVPLLRTRFGTNDVVEKLTVGETEILLNATVESVLQHGSQVKVGCQFAGGMVEKQFDHVVIATQANHAINLVPREDRDLVAALKRFEYEDVRVVVHRDLDLLPVEKKHWSTFNFMVQGKEPAVAENSMCNIWLNKFYECVDASSDWFQAINPFVQPREEYLVSCVDLQRPIVRPDSFLAWELLEKLQGEPDRRVWYSGSYASEGVPLLESGVVSAAGVVNKIKASAAAITN